MIIIGKFRRVKVISGMEVELDKRAVGLNDFFAVPYIYFYDIWFNGRENSKTRWDEVLFPNSFTCDRIHEYGLSKIEYIKSNADVVFCVSVVLVFSAANEIKTYRQFRHNFYLRTFPLCETNVRLKSLTRFGAGRSSFRTIRLAIYYRPIIGSYATRSIRGARTCKKTISRWHIENGY